MRSATSTKPGKGPAQAGRPRGPAGRGGVRLRTAFSLPAVGDRVPRSRQLVLVSVWGAALSAVGIIVGLWVLIRSYQVEAGWFMPAAVATGLSGIGLAIGAFFLIQHERFSRALLAAATAALLAVVVLTALAD